MAVERTFPEHQAGKQCEPGDNIAAEDARADASAQGNRATPAEWVNADVQDAGNLA